MQKTFYFLSGLFLMFTSCTMTAEENPSDKDSKDTVVVNTESESEPTPESKSVPSETCYLHVNGKDSAIIKINIDANNKVTGTYNWVPYEKDGRRGKLNGTVENNADGKVIKATWSYMQEGVNQELPFEALLGQGSLWQKDYDVDPKTGKEILRPENDFKKEHKPVDCGTI